MADANPLKISPDLLRDPGKRIKWVAAHGDAPVISASVPLNRYYRSLSEMHRMAGIHLAEKDGERAFILYLRFISMLLEGLPTHPDFKSYSSPEQKRVQERLRSAVDRAETLKKELKKRYEKESILYIAEEERRLAEQCERDRKMAEDMQLYEQGGPSASNSGGISSLVSPNAPPFPVSAPEVNTYGIGFPSLEPTPRVPEHTYDQPGQPHLNENVNRPVVDRSTKPRIVHDYGDVIPNLAANPHGFKPVIVAASLVDHFLSKAWPNTERGVETCAILCGKMANNRLIVSHAVIPKQNGGPDSCDTEHEEEVFEFQDKHDMITIGWIHTHPTQTAFLSSVDLHTHCSYQLMMPEAIAIVCSPKYEE
uniref:MPN domain-containing protein n=1 Tax=Plectus sambesii TaxID=2011161 RepID=A0A914UKB3_9BILA